MGGETGETFFRYHAIGKGPVSIMILHHQTDNRCLQLRYFSAECNFHESAVVLIYHFHVLKKNFTFVE